MFYLKFKEYTLTQIEGEYYLDREPKEENRVNFKTEYQAKLWVKENPEYSELEPKHE